MEIIFNKSDESMSKNQKKIDVLHYDLFFDLYPEEKFIRADAKLTVHIIDKTLNAIELNFYENFVIHSVTLNGKEAKYKRTDERFIIDYFPSIPDTVLLGISYEGTPERAGLAGFVFGNINDHSLVYTLSEPNFASSWFPCKDFPNDKALLDIKITNDSSQISVSNGILVGIKTERNRRTYHWKTVYPISTYLIAIYSSDYSNFSDTYISQDRLDTMSIDYYVLTENLSNAKIDFSEHVEMMNFFSEKFGEYPFVQEKYGVAEFLWRPGAMEHQTITGISSNMIGGKKLFTDILAHELAHQWWGDAVGIKTWNDIWLNEGFSTYSEALFFEYRSGKSALQSTMRSKFQGNFNGTLSRPGSFIFNRTVYDKGAWVLHMLRWQVGDEKFFEILRRYYQEYKYLNTSTEEFKAICESISGSYLDKFFDQWINGEGVIKIEYEWTAISGVTELTLNQVQSEYDTYHFPIEVQLDFEDGKNERHKLNIESRTTFFRIDHEGITDNVILDPDSWLLADFIEKVNTNE
jgi:aminopeptidase N